MLLIATRECGEQMHVRPVESVCYALTFESLT